MPVTARDRGVKVMVACVTVSEAARAWCVAKLALVSRHDSDLYCSHFGPFAAARPTACALR